ncbi:unnamed protein product (macronuclear) [Paramecium tetraurelia]|uniref:Cyclin N-terminal domain-containing protein n=1 Tax=Paramecium tetraurelia TaxID=5888 RepID=A0E4P5_PARTE|nr:uncharacterized protein GSPATT00023437001 [Paramecium tetraurelia]CAK90262.1 unnamed protein product [Paramecium tetraurelia]|eukprot:XP_001457659.1 hypothetical protein (macronuclear) [Paramecium tetraurelia strain d4-2]
MTHHRPPVPKFNDECLTPKMEISLLEEVQHLIFKMNLDFEIEKKATKIIQTTPLQNTLTSAKGVIFYCLKESNRRLPPVEKKVEYVIKYIEQSQNLNFSHVCQKMGFGDQVSRVCETLKNQLVYLIGKLSINLQIAITIKIAADIIFYKQGGLNTKFLAFHTKVNEEQLKCSLNRIKPFSEKIMGDLFNHYNDNPL